MKKVRIPFSLTEFNKGGYEVETKGSKLTNPRKVRIVCTDRKYEDYPILALISYETVEKSACYRLDGRYIDLQDDYQNLFLVKQEFEDGDIIKRDKFVQFIIPYRGTNDKGWVLTDSYYNFNDDTMNISSKIDYGCGKTDDYHIATEDERKIFFDALAKIGKQWNAEKKCIEDIKPKYDFQPFDKVLVRNFSDSKWMANFFRNYNDDDDTKFRYMCITGDYDQCLPYNDETKDLLCTTGNAPEKYKTW